MRNASINTIAAISVTLAILAGIAALVGYVSTSSYHMTITGIEAAEADPSVKVFQAGTRHDGGKLVTSGGRVLGVTALGTDLAAAKATAYRAVAKISFYGAFYRRDIGEKGLAREQA